MRVLNELVWVVRLVAVSQLLNMTSPSRDHSAPDRSGFPEWVAGEPAPQCPVRDICFNSFDATPDNTHCIFLSEVSYLGGNQWVVTRPGNFLLDGPAMAPTPAA